MRLRFVTCGLVMAVAISGVQAADLAGDCCSDLEDRIAELEATAARKGNRKVSVTITGYVDQADHVLGRWRRAQRVLVRHRPHASDELPVDGRGDDRARLEGGLHDAHSGSHRQSHGPEPDDGRGQHGPQCADVALVCREQGVRQIGRRPQCTCRQERRHVHRSVRHAGHRQLRAVRRRQLLPAQY